MRNWLSFAGVLLVALAVLPPAPARAQAGAPAAKAPPSAAEAANADRTPEPLRGPTRPTAVPGAGAPRAPGVPAPDFAGAPLTPTCPVPPERLPAAVKRPRPAAPPPAAKAACFGAPALPYAACLKPKPLCEEDLAIARVAWKYFEKNFQPATGLVNAVDGYPSTTMWDVASSIAGTLAAERLGLITEKEFDDRVVPLLGTLGSLKLYRNELPNKAYNAATAQMTDYTNKPVEDGLGFSALDLGRLAGWLDVLSCSHPRHAAKARRVLQRWNYCRMVGDGQMYGAVDPKGAQDSRVQEGRLGYEQYAGKLFERLGFDQHVAARYDNPSAGTVDVYGVKLPVDTRDPRKLGAYNYVVTESYALDVIENGKDAVNGPLLERIFQVQKERWKRTGIVTAVSEDNVDRAPYFVYNTIYAAGTAWNTITDQGQDFDQLKSVSTKAAFSLAALFPSDPYSAVLYDTVKSAYDPERGWYSGVYEMGLGYNKAITANTNGIILETLLYKAAGPLHPGCKACGRGLSLSESVEEIYAKDRCLPGAARCEAAQCKAGGP
jgi:hypothetical protein